MSNILKAIINIANNPIVALTDTYVGRNTINNVGQALETYIQDVFASTVTGAFHESRLKCWQVGFLVISSQNYLEIVGK